MLAQYGPPFLHRSPLRLTGSDVDHRRKFIWCQFRRPVVPDTMWDLDLSQPLFHFFFMGEKNGSRFMRTIQKYYWYKG